MALQKGIYQATVTAHQLITSAKKGTPGLSVTVQFNDGWQDQTETGIIWLSAKAAESAREQLKAVGFNPDKHKLSELGAGQTLSLVGHGCSIEIDEEEYQGKSRMKIKRFGAPRPPADELLSQLDDILADAKGPDEAADADEFERANPVPPPPPPTTPAPPAEDSLPF